MFAWLSPLYNHLPRPLRWPGSLLWLLVPVGLGINLLVLNWPSPDIEVRLAQSSQQTYAPMATVPVLVKARTPDGQSRYVLKAPDETVLAAWAEAPPKSGKARRGGSAASYKKKTMPPAHSIDINRAGATELARLPGIGPKMAQRILTDRLHNGSYDSPAALARVKGIGKKTVAKIAPYIKT
ncbi:MAG: ComEA family DNA-binding protein [Cyanobacteria bacterium HKST-UBA03]|nr:ComEA family DNA-binding protein [Cyanobacteria bacterium HKST-UBA03]